MSTHADMPRCWYAPRHACLCVQSAKYTAMHAHGCGFGGIQEDGLGMSLGGIGAARCCQIISKTILPVGGPSLRKGRRTWETMLANFSRQQGCGLRGVGLRQQRHFLRRRPWQPPCRSEGEHLPSSTHINVHGQLFKLEL